MGASPSAKRREGNVVAAAWTAFKIWRRSRPFWGGLWTLLAAIELWCIPFLNQVLTQGTLNIKIGGVAGVSTMAITPMMVIMAICMWFAPNYRVFAAIFTIIVSLLSFNVSNFGGFVLGMLMGLVGGALAFAWSPQLSPEQLAAQERAAAAYRNALVGEDAAPAAQFVPEQAGVHAASADADFYAAEWPDAHTGVQPDAALPHQYAYETTLADPLNTRAATNPSAEVPPPLPPAEDTPLGA